MAKHKEKAVHRRTLCVNFVDSLNKCLIDFKPGLIRLTLGIRVYVVGRSPLPPPFAVTWELAIGDGRLKLKLSKVQFSKFYLKVCVRHDSQQ